MNIVEFQTWNDIPSNFTGACRILKYSTDSTNKTPWADVWYENGREHRLDGPALIHGDGSQFWRKHGATHREDGYAAIWSDNSCVETYRGLKIYYLNDKQLSEKEYWKHPLVQKNKLQQILNQTVDFE